MKKKHSSSDDNIQLTVSQLASRHAISRTTILYYERQGLLSPAYRSANGYRWYGQNEIKRLEAIKSYRAFGLPVSQLKELLDHQHQGSLEDALERQFANLGDEIEKLRQQQQAILTLLEKPQLLETDKLTKKRWTQIMASAGMTVDDMINWHIEFEKKEPEAHQSFLESLHIDSDEIIKMRAQFRQ